MNGFWELRVEAARPALVDGASGASVTYGELLRSADDLAAAFPGGGRKSLGFVLGRNRPATVAAYLAALRGGAAAYLANASLAEPLQHQLIETYRPDWIAATVPFAAPPGYRLAPSWLDSREGALWVRTAPSDDAPPHDALAIMLSTSGTTGSPKLVRLSAANLQANAASIASYLEIGADERPLASLALHYSYGLSVLNSHLLAGATVVLTDASVVDRAFWTLLAEQRATSIAGVPFTYATLHRLRFDPGTHRSLRTMTQAGGRLEPALQDHFARAATRGGARFFVMYGQTEATARISFVPPDALPRKLGSIGRAIPGGALSIDGDDGEIVYRGPNVMLGYATARADLSRGDELGGTLRTGDLGRRDDEGYYFITGRLRRFVKLFGHRVNLDELEVAMAAAMGEAVACHGVDDRIVVLLESPERRPEAERLLTSRFALNPTAVRVVDGRRIPRTPTGKVDYPAILAEHLPA
ncbi:MAG TPA: AMP-binding protein [Candidatus Polarisedimenticolaceae bacterium]